MTEELQAKSLKMNKYCEEIKRDIQDDWSSKYDKFRVNDYKIIQVFSSYYPVSSDSATSSWTSCFLT